MSVTDGVDVWTGSYSFDDKKYNPVEEDAKINVFLNAFKHFIVPANLGKPFVSMGTAFKYTTIFPVYIRNDKTGKQAKFAYVANNGFYGFFQLDKKNTAAETNAAWDARGGRSQKRRRFKRSVRR